MSDNKDMNEQMKLEQERMKKIPCKKCAEKETEIERLEKEIGRMYGTNTLKTITINELRATIKKMKITSDMTRIERGTIISRLGSKLEKMRGMLINNQWSDRDCSVASIVLCRHCGQMEENGHDPDCELKQLIEGD